MKKIIRINFDNYMEIARIVANLKIEKIENE